MNDERVSIYVAAHKKESIDLPDGYQICQVNAAKNGRWDGLFSYDNGCSDNISLKNDRYSELTALYELWKNNDADIKGLAHYRRFFAEKDSLTFTNFIHNAVPKNELERKILKKDTIIQHLKTHDMIVEYQRNPYVVTAYEDLVRFVYPQDIQMLSDTIHLYYPEYEESYYRVLKSTHISYMNMLIARKEILSSYCEWLFDILFKLEDKLDIESYDSQHKRIYGYLGEVLLNVWILKNKPAVKYVFCLLVMPPAENNAKRMIHSLPLFSVAHVIYLRIKKPKVFADHKERFKETLAACCKPYSQTLDEIYCTINSVDDVLEYYSRFYNAVLSEEFVAQAEETASYACVKFEYGSEYLYLQSNNRCIVTLLEDHVEKIPMLIQAIKEKYEDKYTINVRIITHNQEVVRYAMQHPEIYVYRA